jgi:hypothetical protein
VKPKLSKSYLFTSPELPGSVYSGYHLRKKK